MRDLKIECPQCQSTVLIAIPAAHAAEIAPTDAQLGQRRIEMRQNQIRFSARLFTGLAIFGLLLCGLQLIAALTDLRVDNLREDAGHSGTGADLLWAGHFFWFAAWCYLIAQVIHIRANTESLVRPPTAKPSALDQYKLWKAGNPEPVPSIQEN